MVQCFATFFIGVLSMKSSWLLLLFAISGDFISGDSCMRRRFLSNSFVDNIVDAVAKVHSVGNYAEFDISDIPADTCALTSIPLSEANRIVQGILEVEMGQERQWVAKSVIGYLHQRIPPDHLYGLLDGDANADGALKKSVQNSNPCKQLPGDSRARLDALSDEERLLLVVYWLEILTRCVSMSNSESARSLAAQQKKKLKFINDLVQVGNILSLLATKSTGAAMQTQLINEYMHLLQMALTHITEIEKTEEMLSASLSIVISELDKINILGQSS